jgi:hypothetical protein
MNKFDLNKYRIKFDSVFDDEELKTLFRKHLEKEVNTEPLDFIEEVERFKNSEEKERMKKIEEINETYIKSKSKKEINLSGETKEEFFEWLSNNKDQEKLIEAFDKLVGYIKSELEADSFKRFIRTDIVKKKLFEKRENPKVMVPRSQTMFNYQALDFQKWFITPKDINFLDYLNNTDSYDWELSKSKEKTGGNSFYNLKCKDISPNFPEGKNYGILKIQQIYNYSLEKVANVVFPLENFISGILFNIKIESLDENETKKRFENLPEILKEGKVDYTIFMDTHLFNGVHKSIQSFNMKSVSASTIKIMNQGEDVKMLTYYSKYVTEKEDDDITQKTKTFKYAEENKKEKKLKYKTPTGFQCVQLEEVAPNKTMFTLTIFAKASESESLNRIVFSGSSSSMTKDIRKKILKQLIEKKEFKKFEEFDQLDDFVQNEIHKVYMKLKKSLNEKNTEKEEMKNENNEKEEIKIENDLEKEEIKIEIDEKEDTKIENNEKEEIKNDK